MENTSNSKPLWGIIGAIALGSGVIAVGLWQFQETRVVTPEPVTITDPVIKTVTALGRLEPRGRVVQLAAPTSSQENRLAELLVEEGDFVKAGEVVGIMDSHPSALAALEEAEAQVKVAEAKLAVIKAGAKQGEIEAQRAEISRIEAENQGEIDAWTATVTKLKAELENAQTEYNRHQWLYEQGAISASIRDSKLLALNTIKQSLQEAQANLDRLRSTSIEELNQAKATLNQIREIRPVDIREAEAEVNRAITVRDQAQVNLTQTLVRSPIDGEVLYIHTQPGEIVSTDGLMEIGQTQQMQVVAEVYQSDIGRVKPGQRVRVTSQAIDGEMTGTVERISSQVRRQNIVNIDPSANIDARVIEVYIALDPASRELAAKFTNLQVQVVIES